MFQLDVHLAKLGLLTAGYAFGVMFVSVLLYWEGRAIIHRLSDEKNEELLFRMEKKLKCAQTARTKFIVCNVMLLGACAVPIGFATQRFSAPGWLVGLIAGVCGWLVFAAVVFVWYYPCYKISVLLEEKCRSVSEGHKCPKK